MSGEEDDNDSDNKSGHPGPDDIAAMTQFEAYAAGYWRGVEAGRATKDRGARLEATSR